MSDIASELLELMLEIVQPEDRAGVDIDTALLSSGLIDSFQLLEVLNRVEQAFGIHIDETYITLENMDTVNTIVELVNKIKSV